MVKVIFPKSAAPSPEPVVNTSKQYIPIYKPSLTSDEKRNVLDAFSSTWISGTGPYIEKFERLFARFTGAKYAVATNSGTTALHVGYRLLGIQKGDEVIVPAFTMISTATPLVELGAIPVFIDINRYWQIDASLIEKRITPKTKAIVGVHIYGQPCNIRAIETIANKYRLKVLYDAAEAHGALYDEKRLGRFGDVVCYSLYANKIITTGEGGVVTINNKKMYEKSKRLIDEYFSPRLHFWHEDYGYSYRMSNVLAAIGVAQIKRARLTIKKKIKINSAYKRLLSNNSSVSFMPDAPWSACVYWMVAVVLKNMSQKQTHTVRSYLAKRGVETRSAFIPLTLQPAFKQFTGNQRAPVAEHLSGSILLLPSFPDLTTKQIRIICKYLNEALVSSRCTS